ncbi:hypothetical protein DTO027B5_8310 [Paecilomyces variotii]|nr:hypothetical protein DTO169C6_9056 [Paecilomyces variotii]KAJ9231504.1 hypothetical protein DTO169E5_7970 [Paecilomyces variotii]KAJ9252624.1 hypothetical protein DTO207G8_4686 [Paecilomyces variotii]KAJ9284032.1 hypothetical protein DTO021C3_8370 [Paecilomyces variotii]KAJ9308604.1 hypothetical protein DTO217A2_1846 [Paecilomyces variotii]
MPPQFNGPSNGDSRRPQTYTITGLKRWSVVNKEIPAVSQIRAIHVYDFDNTLFLSPLPNPQLWNGQTVGFLQIYESFANGGWWHDPNLLAATGEGSEVEEARGWKGWWNEHIVQLVELSMQQKDALTVLLTGRSEAGFADIIKRMVTSRKLDFDLVCLKPEVGPNNQRFFSTMNFKQTLLEDLVLTYKQADEIRIYEDRVKHVRAFREYFEKLNRSLLSTQPSAPRKPIVAEVIQVAEGCTFLAPVTETAEVQRMINAHNISFKDSGLNKTRSPYGRLQIKRTVFYTGYLISNADSSRLISQLLHPLLPPGLADSNDLKYMANNILITPRPAPKSILDKVGGMGKKLSWQVTGTAVFENKLWAARVTPVPETEKYYTENPVPVIVLAVRKGARPIDAGKIQNWHPVPAEKAFVFDTVVGEKVVLRVEEEDPDEGEWESQFMNKSHKRRHQQDYRDEDVVYPPSKDNQTNSYNNPYEALSYGRHHHHHHQHQRHGHFHDDGARRGGGHFRGGRGRGGGGRGKGSNSGRGGGGRGRGRGRDGGGPPPGYKSLDDYGGYDGGYEDRNGGGGGVPVMNY